LQKPMQHLKFPSFFVKEKAIKSCIQIVPCKFDFKP